MGYLNMNNTWFKWLILNFHCLKFMKKLLFATLSIVLLNISLIAQSNSSFTIIKKDFVDPSSAVPNYLEFDQGALPTIGQLQEVLKPYLKASQDFSFRLVKTEKDNLGYVHYRYVQEYQEKEIEFAEVFLHTKNGFIHSLNGKLIHSSPKGTEKKLSEKEALQSALDYIGAESYKWEIESEEKILQRELNKPDATNYPKGQLVFINPNLDYNAENFKLAYKFNIYAHEPLSRAEYYVDANNGQVIFTNDKIHTSNVQGTANTVYSGLRNIYTDSVSTNSFTLNQTVYGSGINTYDMNNGTSYGASTLFFDTDNNWNNINSQLDQYATDAHFGAEQTYDYFYTKHGRNSINNNGFALNSYVHYANNFVNAFWDGQRMTYGDGNGGSVSPLTSLDIAGHEIAHGLTTFSANLIYASESGALNESFSDIFGTAIEFYARPNNANWTIGEDIGLIIRSMSNPLAYGDPDTKLGPQWKTVVGCTPSQQNDNCGVHSNSGVQNKWFYLLTVGGSGTNGIGNSYSVQGLGIDTAAAIAFRNLTVYLNQSSNFDDARYYSIQSAVDLYGPCSPQVKSVTDAWHAVGVGAAYVPGVIASFDALDTNNCKAPFFTIFNSTSNNAITYQWDFGDGGTSTLKNPSHTYNSVGSFDVKLVVDGGSCGVDSILKLNYIDVDTNLLCEVVLVNGTNPTQTNCVGKLFDSGGSLANYFANENSSIVIAPAGASSVNLNFLSFDVEAGSGNTCNYDKLEIYDGPNTSYPLIGTYCNTTGSPGQINSTRSAVTIVFTSDAGVENAGFEMDWSCNFPSSAPATDFSANTSRNCIGEVSFTDLSTNGPNNWLWNFGDGNTSTLANPVHTYANNGTYTIQLISSNSIGADTSIKSNLVTINRPQAPSAIGDTFCLNQTINLSASGNGRIQWYTSQSSQNPIATGPNFNLTAQNIDTSFWVEDYIEAPLLAVGPASNTIGSGANFNNDQYLVFDVFKTIILKRVAVYSGASGNRVIQLRDASGTPVITKSVYIPTGYNFVNLDLQIDPGTDYQLGLAPGSMIDLYRNNGGVSFPYAIQNLVSIKRSSASTNPTGFYYFFYDWRVKELDCSSSRVEVVAKIDSTCTVTSIDNLIGKENNFELFPNPASNKLNIHLNSLKQNVLIEVYSYSGQIIYSESFNSVSNTLLNTSSWSNGVYHIQLTGNDFSESKSFIINH